MDAMDPAPRLPHWARRALVLAAVWSIPGLVVTVSVYTVYALKNEPIAFGKALLWRMPPWYVWAVATPLIIWLARRYPPWRAPWLSIPIHLLANAAISSCEIIVYCLCGRLVGEEPFTTGSVLDILPWMLLKTCVLEMLIYWAVIFIGYAITYQRRYRESALRQSQLEARLVEAQLDALKMQLHPHFLFNTLNAISVLMRKGESASAIRMLGGLSDLLRRSLSSLRVELVPLRDELDFIARYLEIETTRFPDRLRVAVDVEERARSAKVPNLILQPIVENAIKHGIAPRASGGRIEITARVIGDRLRIEVRDDGVGFGGAPQSAGHGLGLSHVRKRLAQLYGGACSFALEPGDPGGALAVLEIPFEEQA